MRIMIIVPSLSGGGAERVATTLASQFVMKHEVVLVTYYSVDAAYSIDERVVVECLEISGGSSLINKNINSIKRIRQLKKLKRKYDIECAISFLYAPNFENVMSRGRERVIVSLRHKYSVNYHGLKGAINSFTCKKADLSVALSKNVMYDQITNYNTPRDKIITIYNPCNLEKIDKLANEPTNNESFDQIREQFDRIIITAGRLTEQKGQWHLIRAFSSVVKQYPSTALVILGEGELKGYLNDLILEYGLENKVLLLGFHKNPYTYLHKADIFAFTSLFEGFGNILLEAMACGLPIVSCDCDAGPRELLAPETDLHHFADKVQLEKYGILSPVMDGKKYGSDVPLTYEELQFAEGLSSLLSNSELLSHYSLCSKTRIQDFKKEVITQIWENHLK